MRTLSLKGGRYQTAVGALFFINEEYCLKVIGAFALMSFRIYMLLSFMNFNGKKFSDDFSSFLCFKGRSDGPLIICYSPYQ